MSAQKYIDKICIVAIVFSVLVSCFLLKAGAADLAGDSRVLGYEKRLFDTSYVHTLEIVMEDWEGFIEECEKEEYAPCTVVIDGEAYRNIGIRAKGNTSLSTVSAMGSSRYSFKLEFDQYDSSKSYHGLDKLSLNNIIQDNTYMKDYLTYQMMQGFGVNSPLCSYVFITVNGEDWGLYLAVEGIEEAFLQRNYGRDYGELYKPDNMDFGGGRENGQAFTPGTIGDPDVKLQYIDDNPESYPNIFRNAKTDVTKADQTRLIESLSNLANGTDIERVVNIEEVIRYFVVHNFVCNGDSYTGTMVHNYYLYEEDGQLSMLPWDYNLAFGTFEATDAIQAVNMPIDSPVSTGDNSDRPMLHWIFESEPYTELYHQYFMDFIENTDFGGIIDETKERIASYVKKDPGKFCTEEEFEKGVAAIRDFCLLRAESVQGQLEGQIPSTLEAQAASSDSLIDASELVLSDMGTMGNGGKGAPSEMLPAGIFSKEEVPFSGKQFLDSSQEGNLTGGQELSEELPEESLIEFPEGGSGGFFGSGDIPEKGTTEEGIPERNIGGEGRPGKNMPGGGIPARDTTAAGSSMKNASSLLLLSLSAVVLGIGLLIAFFYKR